MEQAILPTRYGEVSVAISAGAGPALLMLHGNSSCKEVFRHQMLGPVGAEYRSVAMDLPGHGRSSDARDPARTYCFGGYAEVALDVMRRLGLQRFAVLGWSLGGHIGIELMEAGALEGLMITGAPPMRSGPAGFKEGFKPSRHMTLAGQRRFNEEEIEAYSRATCGANAPFEPFLRDAVARADGFARENMIAAIMAGAGCDQRTAAERARAPFAIVNGADDEFIDNNYIASISYERLWENKVHQLGAVGHAPFWEAPAVFDPYLIRFMRDLQASPT